MTVVSSHWGVLVTQRHCVSRVDETLTQRGVDHFIPLIETLSIVHGRHVREQRPMLGDYIPIAIDAAWKSLIRVRGVASILLNELGFPAQVLPSEMDRLHAMCDDCVYRSAALDDGNGFTYGQRVTPKDGPFVYYTGRYDGKANKRGDQAALFLCFGREQRVVFKPGELLAV